jgi:hypothetical protein
MLTLSDVKGIARARFFLGSPWRWDTWILNIVSIWMLVGFMVILAFILINMPTTSQLSYTIPQSVIGQGEDVKVMYLWNTGYTVNGYLLTMAESNAAVNILKAMLLLLFSILVFLPMVIMVVYVSIRDAMLTKYVENFASAWAVKKELPE